MDTLGELLDAARLLTEQPLPDGDRIVIVGNAGGLNILAADAGEAAGLRVIEMSADVQQQFADLAPHLAGVANPVDLGADAPPETIGRAVRALAASAEADALVVTLVATRTNDLLGALDALSGVAEDQPQLPIVAVVVGGAAPRKLGRGTSRSTTCQKMRTMSCRPNSCPTPWTAAVTHGYSKSAFSSAHKETG